MSGSQWCTAMWITHYWATIWTTYLYSDKMLIAYVNFLWVTKVAKSVFHTCWQNNQSLGPFSHALEKCLRCNVIHTTELLFSHYYIWSYLWLNGHSIPSAKEWQYNIYLNICWKIKIFCIMITKYTCTSFGPQPILHLKVLQQVKISNITKSAINVDWSFPVN